MSDLLVTLLGSAGALVFVGGLIVAFFLTYWLPLMAFRTMRNIAHIRIEFERLNATLERIERVQSSRRPDIVADAPLEPAAAGFFTRTGPLNLR